MNKGKPFNWSYFLTRQLKIHVANALNPPKGGQARFYMSAYLLDEISTHNAFLDMNWTWTPRDPIIHIHCKLLLECNHYRGVMEKLIDHFLIPLYMLIFEEEPPCMSCVVMEAVLKIEDWFSSPNGNFLKVFGG